MNTDIDVFGYDIDSIKAIEFGILGNKEVRDMSALDKKSIGIEHAELYDNLEPKRGGLIDPRMGTSSNSLSCTTCGLNILYCVGHFGHIKLGTYAFNTGYIEHIRAILSCICLNCSKLLVDRDETELTEALKHTHRKHRFAEIRAMAKKVKYCNKSYRGCGSAKPQIKFDSRKSSSILLIAEYINKEGEANVPTDTSSANVFEKKSKINLIITPEICYNIFRNISDDDLKLMGFNPDKERPGDKKLRPEDMIYKYFPVPPVQVRPSTKADFLSTGTSEDDLTKKISDIVKANERFYDKDRREKIVKKQIDNSLLQYYISSYLNNESSFVPQSEHRGQPTQSLVSRIKRKEGRIRGNLMGKRTDFSARTVITADPSVNINEVGVPMRIVMNLTKKEVVTPHNIERLTQYVKNGRDKYPGANFVILMNRTDDGRPISRNVKYMDKIDLRYGDMVERHLLNGDPVLLNRQPTLHKTSMMCHYVKIIDNEKINDIANTFRLNLAITKPYNADFDGDEMNIFLPQSIHACIEMEEIADAKRQIVDPGESNTIIGVVQDGVLGAYLMTDDKMKIDWKTAMNLMSYTDVDISNMKKKDYTGKELYSMIIPNKIRTKSKFLTIERGLITNGQVNSKYLSPGGGSDSLVRLILEEYGHDRTRQFLDDTQRLINHFNLHNGFSVGIGDIDVNEDIEKNIKRVIDTKILEMMHKITDVENNPEVLDSDAFEQKLHSEFSNLREETGKFVIKHLKKDNGFNVMITSGSKGKNIYIAQMGGCVGQQDVEGKRIKKAVNGRSMVYFHQGDDSAKAGGFVAESYLNGLEYPSFIMHNMGSREGLIDTAIKTAESGYVQRRLIKLLEDLLVGYDGTVRTGTNKVIQFTYGDGGIDPVKQISLPIELLKMNNKVLEETYKFTSAELKKVSFKDNDKYFKKLLDMRDTARHNFIRSKIDYTITNADAFADFKLAVNYKRIIESIDDYPNGGELKPDYILEKLEEIVSYDKTQVLCLDAEDKKNKNSLKYRDDQLSKTILYVSLHSYLAPKRCIFEYKLNKKQFDEICKKIIDEFNRSVIEPGEMVGILASQSIGEPVTQLTLNSVDWEE